MSKDIKPNQLPQSDEKEAHLLRPLTIRGVTLKNRIAVSPMCQYCSKEGIADDWHLVHLGSRAVGGAGLVFTEAASVTSQGRITPGDLGIWNDAQIEPLARIASFIHRMGSVAGIQLAHAGRKASCQEPWNGGNPLSPLQGGWEVVAPSQIPFSPESPMPIELTKAAIGEIKQAFIDAIKRSLKAGFKVIEIHSAHGYLIHEFLSPLSNRRSDEYGGSFENRIRFLCEVVIAARKVIPETMPLFVRISATDWVAGGWDIDQSVELAKKLKTLGVDLIDTSSGALLPHVKIPAAPNYQVPFAMKIRKEAHILTGTVGMITDAHQANDILAAGSADLIFLAREFLREPYWGLKAAQAFDQDPPWPEQYHYAVRKKSK